MTNTTTVVDLESGQIIDEPRLFDEDPQAIESPYIDKITAALIDAQPDLGPIVKEANNPAFRSKYATLKAYTDALRLPLAKHRLLLTGQTICTGGKHRLFTRVIHDSGQWFGSWWELSPVKADPQGEGSALTYARRYQIGVVLQVAAEDDDDGNAASGHPERQRRAAPVTPAPTAAGWLKAATDIADDTEVPPVERRVALLKLMERCERASQMTPELNRKLIDVGKRIAAAIEAPVAEAG